MMKNRACKCCGLIFEGKRKDAIFCCKKCYSKWYHIYKRCSWYPCKHCGDMFPCYKHRKSNIRDKKFCSPLCKTEYFNSSNYKSKYNKNILLKCEICGNEFKKIRYQRVCSGCMTPGSFYSWTNEKQKQRFRNDSDNLTDQYIIAQLASRHTRIKRDLITPELINLKREQLMHYREMKKIIKVTSNDCNNVLL